MTDGRNHAVVHAAPESGRTVLEVQRISKSFGAVQALEDVSVSLRAGEILGLLGDNGAGKSTLVKCLSGSLSPDSGTVKVDGAHVALAGPENARKLGIETVFQDLSLIDNLDVAENLFLGREPRSRWPVMRQLGWMDKKRMYRETRETFEDLGIRLPSLKLPMAHLSGGQRQIVSVTRGAKWGQHILLMDEPAAALGVEQSRIVLELVQTLAERGVAVVFITHNMQEVVEVCHRAVVLRHGRVIGDVDVAQVTPRDLVDLITGAVRGIEHHQARDTDGTGDTA